MATSIGKLSKSFFVKLLVGIIILPFVFWGMGDVFRGGNQNIIATIGSKKINTQEFLNYFNRLDLNQNDLKNIKKSDLFEQVLSEYIGKQVMALEIEKSGIVISDNSLRDIIKNEKIFFKNDKFSRTEYEKFLLKSGVTAPTFEKNIIEQESKRQYLDSLAGGITISKILVEKEFKKENQIKKIEYIDLNKYYLNQKPSKEQIKEIYEKNKKLFIKEYKSIQYAEITPKLIVNINEYNELFFKQLDAIENNVLDGQPFEETARENNLKVITVEKIDANKKDVNDNKNSTVPDKLFRKIFLIKEEKIPEVVKVNNKYYLVEVKSITKKNLSINNPDVLKIVNNQIDIQNKIKNNTSIAKDIGMGAFDKTKMEKFASDNNLEIKKYEILNLKQNEIFSEGIIKNIFLISDGEITLITDSNLSKNFLIQVINTKYKKLENNSNEFEKYEAKARLNLVNKIYKTFDENINKKYKVELNKKTIERVKNSF